MLLKLVGDFTRTWSVSPRTGSPYCKLPLFLESFGLFQCFCWSLFFEVGSFECFVEQWGIVLTCVKSRNWTCTPYLTPCWGRTNVLCRVRCSSYDWCNIQTVALLPWKTPFLRLMLLGEFRDFFTWRSWWDRAMTLFNTHNWSSLFTSCIIYRLFLSSRHFTMITSANATTLSSLL